MKVRMLTGLGGIDFSLTRGDVTGRFSDAEAIRLINSHFAEAVDPDEEAKIRPVVEAEWAAAAEAEAAEAVDEQDAGTDTVTEGGAELGAAEGEQKSADGKKPAGAAKK